MKSNGFYANHQPGQANFDMIEGSETCQVDSLGKVVNINGTREVLWFNIVQKYNINLKYVGCM